MLPAITQNWSGILDKIEPVCGESKHLGEEGFKRAGRLRRVLKALPLFRDASDLLQQLWKGRSVHTLLWVYTLPPRAPELCVNEGKEKAR